MTDGQILQDVSDALKAGQVSNLQPYYPNLVAEWHLQAFNDIIGVLSARKYSLSQILLADNGPLWERSLAKYFIFTQPQTQGVFDPEAVKAWDCRPTLRTVTIVTNSIPVYPQGGPADATPGEFGVGTMQDSGGERFPGDIKHIRW